MTHLRSICTAALLLSLSPAALGEAPDWAEWRGPRRDGKSIETGLLTAWPEGGPPLLFRADGLGGGYSTLSLAGDGIFTLGDLDGSQYALRLRRSDGKPVWKTKIGTAWKDRYRGPRSTPTVDDGAVYVLSTDGDVVCLARKTGKEIWRTSMPDLGSKGSDGAGYSSVQVVTAAGVRQYVQLLGRGVIGVDAKTGRFLWGYNGIANHVANIATPLVVGDQVFVSTGYNTGSALVQLRADGDGVVAEEVYFLDPKTLQNHHGGLVHHEGHVYTGTGHNKGFPICVELKTGKVAWGPIRNKGRDSAAITFADGHLYFRYQNGLMVLVEATPEEYREKGSFLIPDVQMESWANPVIAGGKLYLREQENLFCYDVSAPSD